MDSPCAGRRKRRFHRERRRPIRYNAAVRNVLIVGCGDVARRALPRLVGRYRVHALLRRAEEAGWWRQHGAVPIFADLDDRRGLDRVAGLADVVLHFAPPPDRGDLDTRTRNLLAALGKRRSLPQRLVYISTSGVYGDCGGARIDETRRVAPRNARAVRRVDAERRLRDFGCRGPRVSILRAPGIYAADRLPLARLEAGTPALSPGDDVYTNHIHADDLAAAAVAALVRGGANRVYHASDDSTLRMGDYFDCVADCFGLPRPRRLPRAEAAQVLSPVLLSFMSESRRLDNGRLKRELRVRLAWPRVEDAVAAVAREKGRKCS